MSTNIDAVAGLGALGGVGALGGAAGGASAKALGAAAGGTAPSFVDMLKKSLEQVNKDQNTADTAAVQYQTGQNNVSLEDAMVSMQKANISFQAAVQVRNRLVSAYTDVMNMQI
jgi:flagellar hook-basal body complex protein FliE